MPSARVCVELSNGNLRNHHIYLRRVISFFPSDAVGGSNETGASQQTIRAEFDAGPTVETDIDGDKLILRARGAVADFFARSGAKAGDRVSISRVGARHFKFTFVKERRS